MAGKDHAYATLAEFPRPYRGDITRSHPTANMLNSHFKIALRHLRKSKTYRISPRLVRIKQLFTGLCIPHGHKLVDICRCRCHNAGHRHDYHKL